MWGHAFFEVDWNWVTQALPCDPPRLSPNDFNMLQVEVSGVPWGHTHLHHGDGDNINPCSQRRFGAVVQHFMLMDANGC